MNVRHKNIKRKNFRAFMIWKCKRFVCCGTLCIVRLYAAASLLRPPPNHTCDNPTGTLLAGPGQIYYRSLSLVLTHSFPPLSLTLPHLFSHSFPLSLSLFLSFYATRAHSYLITRVSSWHSECTVFFHFKLVFRVSTFFLQSINVVNKLVTYWH